MKTIVLANTTDTLELVLAWAVATTQADITVHRADATTLALVEWRTTITSNGATPVTICPAPAASTRRIIKDISVYNADTAAITFTISYNENGTKRVIVKWNLATLKSWAMDDGLNQTGDVFWPSVATNLNIAVFDSTSGKLIKDGGATVASLVPKSLYDAQTILHATADDTPVALTVTEQTLVGRVTWGNIAAIAIDSDLSSTSANDDTVPSAKATKAMGDSKLPLAGGTMTGKIVSSWSSEVGKTYTPATWSQTVALDCALNNMHIVTGHADGTAITFTVANATNSQCFIVSILQGATTPSTIAGWFATVRWAGWSAPTLTATVNKRDTFWFIRTWTNTYDWFVIWQNC